MTEIEKVTDYIYSIPKFAKKGGLSQTAQLMALFGDPQTSFNIFILRERTAKALSALIWIICCVSAACGLGCLLRPIL